MNDTLKKSAGDWNRLAGQIRAHADADVTDMDLARLRRTVRNRIETTRHGSSRWVRLAALAACAGLAAVGIGGLGLTGMVAGGPAATDGQAPHFTLTRADTGELVFTFADGKPVHRIARSLSPRPGSEVLDVQVAKGRLVAESNGVPQPGTAVFYRID